jgi:hypothetical protein
MEAAENCVAMPQYETHETLSTPHHDSSLVPSAECQSKRIAPDKIRHPLKTLSRAVRSKPHVKVLAIGSSSTVGLGASSPTEQVVGAIADVAREAGILLVDRFDAMRELQGERGDRFYLTADSLHMNDFGYRCMAEQLARVIVGGLVQADGDQPRPVFYP